MNSNLVRKRLLASTMIMGMAAVAAPALAQGSATPAPTAAVEADESDVIVVTGSIIRSTVAASATPVTVLDFANEQVRGNNTVNDAIQSLSANGAGMLPNAFTANGAFAAGASAVSLRGLLTSNTLVLFDGMRAAYYPLADDGTRNFVDLNTIPDAIVERVDVLKEGASSTYGADAVAGVVNVITKREIQGLHATVEAGISQRGDAGEQRLEATYGYGDLDEQGFNVYASGMYFRQEGLDNSQRGYPYNTGNLCSLGINTGYAFNNECNLNLAAVPVNFVRPSGPNNDVAAGADSRFQLLNPSLGCQGLPSYNLTAEQLADNPSFPSTVCSDDWPANYFAISPDIERLGASLRGTVALTDRIEGYAMFNFVQSQSSYYGLPTRYRGTTPPAQTGVTYSTNAVALPVYICASGVNCDTAADRVLNPQNPFAAQGSQARLTGFLPGSREFDDIRSRAYRVAAGIRGSFGDDWNFNIDGTAMRVNNRWERSGYVYVANLLQAINTGSFDFVNPGNNTQADYDFIAPTMSNSSHSKMYHLQADLSKALFALPGGDLEAAVGASIRRESVNAPSANPDNTDDPDTVDPTQHWLRINPFGAIGQRTVKSAYGQIIAPVIEQVILTGSGRYDKYSTGQKAFSPKLTAKIMPVREVAFRGSWSKGFRIGSFAEMNALPTTGYITGGETVPEAYAALFPGGASNPYLSSYSLGLTQVGNPDLKPEKSTSITAGITFEPIRNFTFSVDYWDIKKKNVITGADYTGALAAYYAGQPIPDGFTIIPDEPDVANPNILPRAAFIQYSYVNAAQQRASGVDFEANATFDISDGLKFRSRLEGTYLIRLNTKFDSGTQKFAGTIGPYVITSAAGSPRWRGSWQNTLDWGNAYVSATAYYTHGYKTTAEDITGPDSRDDCANSLSYHVDEEVGPTQCRVKRYIQVNMSAGYDITDNLNLYVNVNNLFDAKPPLDYATYGGYLYNPAWHQGGIIGRYFRIGAKIKM